MFYDSIITPPSSEPITLDYFKKFIRMNPSLIDEDDILPDMITDARMRFEHLTNRPVMPTVIRQYVDTFARHYPGQRWFRWNHSAATYPEMTWPYASGFLFPTIYLMHGTVTTVSSVYYRDATTNDYVASTTHTVDLVSAPPRVYWTVVPPISITTCPVAYVEYTAGWADAGHVPADVRRGIAILAAHFYENRSAYTTDNLKELPLGFLNLCAKYTTGTEGPWGM